MDLTVATANVLHGRAPARRLADVVGWQEADTDAWHAAARALTGHSAYVPPGPARAVPITWRDHLTATADSTYLYAVGGRKFTAGSNTTTVRRYEPATNRWVVLPDTPEPVSGAGAAIVDGQLIELIDTKGTKLYANIGEAPSASATYLPVSFTTAKNTLGTFAYQGDTLTWSAAGVQRQNVAAWYVCENQSLWINLGAYLYGTPAGCVDQTVSFFSGFFLRVFVW